MPTVNDGAHVHTQDGTRKSKRQRESLIPKVDYNLEERVHALHRGCTEERVQEALCKAAGDNTLGKILKHALNGDAAKVGLEEGPAIAVQRSALVWLAKYIAPTAKRNTEDMPKMLRRYKLQERSFGVALETLEADLNAGGQRAEGLFLKPRCADPIVKRAQYVEIMDLMRGLYSRSSGNLTERGDELPRVCRVVVALATRAHGELEHGAGPATVNLELADGAAASSRHSVFIAAAPLIQDLCSSPWCGEDCLLEAINTGIVPLLWNSLNNESFDEKEHALWILGNLASTLASANELLKLESGLMKKAVALLQLHPAPAPERPAKKAKKAAEEGEEKKVPLEYTLQQVKVMAGAAILLANLTEVKELAAQLATEETLQNCAQIVEWFGVACSAAASKEPPAGRQLGKSSPQDKLAAQILNFAANVALQWPAEARANARALVQPLRSFALRMLPAAADPAAPPPSAAHAALAAALAALVAFSPLGEAAPFSEAQATEALRRLAVPLDALAKAVPALDGADAAAPPAADHADAPAGASLKEDRRLSHEFGPDHARIALESLSQLAAAGGFLLRECVVDSGALAAVERLAGATNANGALPAAARAALVKPEPAPPAAAAAAPPPQAAVQPPPVPPPAPVDAPAPDPAPAPAAERPASLKEWSVEDVLADLRRSIPTFFSNPAYAAHAAKLAGLQLDGTELELLASESLERVAGPPPTLAEALEARRGFPNDAARRLALGLKNILGRHLDASGPWVRDFLERNGLPVPGPSAGR